MVPAMAKVSARWSRAKVKFDIESASGHSASIDESGTFGDDEAMRPTEMLLGSLGGCTGINAVLLLRKFKQPLKSLTIEVEGEQEKEWPRRFTKIDLTFVLGWAASTTTSRSSRRSTSLAIATAPSTRRSRTAAS